VVDVPDSVTEAISTICGITNLVYLAIAAIVFVVIILLILGAIRFVLKLKGNQKPEFGSLELFGRLPDKSQDSRLPNKSQDS